MSKLRILVPVKRVIDYAVRGALRSCNATPGELLPPISHEHQDTIIVTIF
jgi:hypothetical protein